MYVCTYVRVLRHLCIFRACLNSQYFFFFLFLYALHRILLLSFSSINQPTNQPTFQKLLLYEVDQLSELVITYKNSMNPLLSPFVIVCSTYESALVNIYFICACAIKDFNIFVRNELDRKSLRRKK